MTDRGGFQCHLNDCSFTRNKDKNKQSKKKFAYLFIKPIDRNNRAARNKVNVGNFMKIILHILHAIQLCNLA